MTSEETEAKDNTNENKNNSMETTTNHPAATAAATTTAATPSHTSPATATSRPPPKTAAAADNNDSTLIVGLSLPPLLSPDGGPVDGTATAAAAKPNNNASELLHKARQDSFDFVTTVAPTGDYGEAGVRWDVLSLDYRWWQTSVVSVIVDEPSEGTKASSRSSLGWSFAMEWSLHMSVPAMVLPPLPVLPEPNAKLQSQVLSEYAVSVSRACQAVAARAGGSASSQQHAPHVWIPVPLTRPHLILFQRLLALCDYAPQIELLLCLPPVSATNSTLSEQLRLVHLFLGSVPNSLACVALPCQLFLTNKRGYPTLSRQVQLLACYLMIRCSPKWLIQGPACHHPTPVPGGSPSSSKAGVTGCLPYLQYLQHLRQRADVKAVLDIEAARLERPYLDQLQKPLQPLSDSLENSTYETFEKDPVKYQQYEHALYNAMYDRIFAETNGDDANKNATFNVVVAGAGRGPLVTCTLRAYARIHVRNQTNERVRAETIPSLSVYAVEKNPSAVLYLKSLAHLDPDWVQAGVTVVPGDLRTLSSEQLRAARVQRHPSAAGAVTADIVVSELLGSFGCNELSPECLSSLLDSDVCAAGRTISIPTRYTSHLVPVSSVKLYNQARQQALFPRDGRSDDGVVGLQRAMETPYVVRSHQASQMYAEEDCWEFVHMLQPMQEQEKDLERSAALSFTPDPNHGVAYGSGYGPIDMSLQTQVDLQRQLSGEATPASAPCPFLLTGFLGTFTADLYYRPATKEMVRYSTAPTRFSTGMFSWFPLYFPIDKPLLVPAGAIVEARIWRYARDSAASGSGSVWYEWSARVHTGDGKDLAVTPIHNPGGRSCQVSLSTSG